ncbi:MAG: glycosyltransferase family 4 protein [Mariprofundales bacterium]
MHILIVTHYFYPEQFRINDLAQSLLARGHKVTVLTGLPNYPKGEWMDGYGYGAVGEEDWQGVRIVRVPTLRRFMGKGWQLALNYFSFVISACLLAPFWCREDYDIIFTYEPSPFTVGIPAVMLRWLHNVPMMFWVQDLWPESLTAVGAVQSPKVLAIVAKVVGWIYRHCDVVLVQSEAFIEPAIAAGANRTQTRYFPNWAESSFQPVAAPEQRQVPEGFVIMFAGNLGEAQSLQTIIKAATILRNIQEIQWVIVGDGRRMAWMQQQVNKQGLRQCVYFLGRHPTKAMPLFFAQADALLVTLKADPVFSQTIPSKLQSYLACGRPVLAALDGEGARVVQQSGGGIAVNSEDASALAEAVLRLYNMQAVDREDMGQRGRAFFEKEFEHHKLVKRLESWMLVMLRSKL